MKHTQQGKDVYFRRSWFESESRVASGRLNIEAVVSMMFSSVERSGALSFLATLTMKDNQHYVKEFERQNYHDRAKSICKRLSLLLGFVQREEPLVIVVTQMFFDIAVSKVLASYLSSTSCCRSHSEHAL